MTHSFSPELERLVREKLATGRYASQEEVLLEAMRALEERDQALAGIRQGIAEMDAGSTRPLDEVDAELRSRHGIRKGEA